MHMFIYIHVYVDACIHICTFIHIQQDNVMITSRGHIKLTDFGLAAPWTREGKDVYMYIYVYMYV
jgi:hypothetical protein